MFGGEIWRERPLGRPSGNGRLIFKWILNKISREDIDWVKLAQERSKLRAVVHWHGRERERPLPDLRWCLHVCLEKVTKVKSAKMLVSRPRDTEITILNSVQVSHLLLAFVLQPCTERRRTICYPTFKGNVQIIKLWSFMFCVPCIMDRVMNKYQQDVTLRYFLFPVLSISQHVSGMFLPIIRRS
jgi:hypothetical protein